MFRESLMRKFSAIIIAVNLALALISLSNLYILGTGAVRVELPREDEFYIVYDDRSESIIFYENYTVQNRAFYDIFGLDIHSWLISENGVVVMEYSEKGAEVKAFTIKEFKINVSMPLEKIVEGEHYSILYKNLTLKLKVKINAYYLFGLVKFSVDDDNLYPWTSPLSEYRYIMEGGTLLSEVMDSMPPSLQVYKEHFKNIVVKTLLSNGMVLRERVDENFKLEASYSEHTLHIKAVLLTSKGVTVHTSEIELEKVDGQYRIKGVRK